jgi:hypothetical protein
MQEEEGRSDPFLSVIEAMTGRIVRAQAGFQNDPAEHHRHHQHHRDGAECRHP